MIVGLVKEEFYFENLVGDNEFSWGFTSRGTKRSCLQDEPYGKEWLQGDMITLDIDRTKGTLSFSVNSKE